MSSPFIRTVIMAVAINLFAHDAAANPSPNEDIELIDGHTLSAGALNTQGALYVFWATWCHVCRAEFPLLQALHDRRRPGDAHIVMVSLDEQAHDVLNFVRQHGYTLPVVMRPESMRERFGRILGTPTHILVSPGGATLERRLGALSREELKHLLEVAAR